MDLGQTIGILANIGVIAGIAFLAIEIQQNNQLLHAETIGNLLDTRMVRTELLLTNPELSSLVTKNRGDAPLTEEDFTILVALHSRSLLGWEKDYLLFKAGILDEASMRANLSAMQYAFHSVDEQYGHIDHWNDIWRELAEPNYRDFIEQCVIVDCETLPK